MLFDDTFLTIDKPAEGIFRDRGSKFLAFVYPINTESDIKPLLTQLRSDHPKANHHCWAMRLGIDRSVFRTNDDGEPSGTAGRPILNTLFSRNITNVLVVVVRYFGGTLLGVPGLINAYRTAAEEALNTAVVIEKMLHDIYTIQFDYQQMNDVMRIIKEDNLTVLDQQFDNTCIMKIGIRRMQVNQSIARFEKVSGAVIKLII
ncbi:uncharacterized protein, YigZ family [Mucilaginibacter mallensis]|uniref:Uncharacterized protein, YigZ family n=1 Tax=Mucilaginibacter mallensis TaxID=652787 RepID=A0A1H1UX06_MUCMA|nr:YigZ family protein [Mucilaginibacter mallensis]SDS77128.1 uncharacterized protein, YigZ family [Mucilaginibacter mallensis]